MIGAQQTSHTAFILSTGKPDDVKKGDGLIKKEMTISLRSTGIKENEFMTSFRNLLLSK